MRSGLISHWRKILQIFDGRREDRPHCSDANPQQVPSTSPPFAVPAGSVQLEDGVTWSAEQRSNVVAGPQTLLRVGVAHCADIFFGVPDYVYALAGNAASGFSDFAASAKLQLPKFIGFDSAAIAGISFPTGGSEISSNGYDPELQLPFRRALDHHWALDGMFGITWFTTEPHDNPSFDSTFELERDLGESGSIFDATARQRPRQKQALPILERLHSYLQAQQATALPKSPLGAAIGYALRNWVALTRYAEDGRLKIDNNGAEQALRPIVLGRKNWLFAGSEAAAHRAAILCSLVQTCKHLQINPFVYLRDVIERVSTHPARLVSELTPREWKRLRQVSGAQAA